MGNKSGKTVDKFDPTSSKIEWKDGVSTSPGRLISIRGQDLEGFQEAIEKDNIKVFVKMLKTCRHRNSYQGQTLHGLYPTDRPYVKNLVATDENDKMQNEDENLADLAVEDLPGPESETTNEDNENNEELPTDELNNERRTSSVNTLKFEGLNGEFTTDPENRETYDYTVEECDTFLHFACRHHAGKIVKWLLHWSGGHVELLKEESGQQLLASDLITEDSFREFYDDYLSGLNLAETAPVESAKAAATEAD